MTTTTDQPDLATRVQQFVCMELPGQPRGMHMGTSYLVNDLWREVQRLRAGLTAIASMKREDLYYADGQPHDNAAAAYAAEILKD